MWQHLTGSPFLVKIKYYSTVWIPRTISVYGYGVYGYCVSALPNGLRPPLPTANNTAMNTGLQRSLQVPAFGGAWPAQSAEHMTLNPGVGGSSPTLGVDLNLKNKTNNKNTHSIYLFIF